jgi:hypothetical protein
VKRAARGADDDAIAAIGHSSSKMIEYINNHYCVDLVRLLISKEARASRGHAA